MTHNKHVIIWTKVDEAPALASYSLLPIIKSFAKSADIDIITKDISLAGRTIANFPDFLKKEQQKPDDLAFLSELTNSPDANIIKLPNISASIPQLQATIKELQEKGYNIPDFPEEPQTEEQKELRKRFSKLLGSAVNPVLRQGNSDRRAAESVKRFAQKYPHKMMKPWSKNSKTRVAHMSKNDFYGNEKSVNLGEDKTIQIILKTKNGKIILKENIKVDKGEILDGTFMNVKELQEFYRDEIKKIKKEDNLLSLHLKATMMKVSDPVLFGYAVKEYYKDGLEKHRDVLNEIGFNPNNGLADLYKRIKKLPLEQQQAIEKDIQQVYKKQADLAMVDSEKGITNLHVPNNIIIDASMPVVIRDGGRMWNAKGELQDTTAIIPDRTYSRFYQVVIEDAQKNGAFDPATMGTVQNIGLMAQKAEEYGSHPTTFIIPEDGTVEVIDENNHAIIMQHNVSKGDIWRMSRTKDIAVKDWVKLAVTRGKITGYPIVFWLDKNRAHDQKIIEKVEKYLKEHDTNGLDIHILSLEDAMRFTLERVRKGQNTIAVTGNVMRDYLTDLFPILELGTSARMLSIVPLLSGGGLFETGAGGSAPKHVQQFIKEGHLRWDSLGEFLALMSSFNHIANKYKNKKADILSKTLDQAIGDYLENKRSPKRKVKELDNRGSHFYLAKYWSNALSNQNDDLELKKKFKPLAKELKEKEKTILREIMEVEGAPVDLGGYYLFDNEKVEKSMRPSKTFNEILNNI